MKQLSNIDFPLQTPPVSDISLPTEVEIPDDEIDEDVKVDSLSSARFDDNLADFLDDSKLTEIATNLIEAVDSDLLSRADWEKSYTNGLQYLGMTAEDRNDPWPGACGVFHPLLTEAVVRFQSQAIIEIFPSAGPVRTKIMGKHTPERTKQAVRIEDEMNFILTEKMPEYRGETEQLLFRLPLAGSVFRKVYFDPVEKRPMAMMVPAEDFIVPYGASDLK